jgi:hypothetical protein
MIRKCIDPGSNKSLWLSLAGLLLVFGPGYAQAASVQIAKANFSVKARTLAVDGAARAGEVRLYDADNDQWLATMSPDNGKFSFRLSALPRTPCTVRAEAGGMTAVKAVSGAPECAKGDLPPVCEIVNPADDIQIGFGESRRFVGKAIDPENTFLHYEWDFGGGADARLTTADAGNILFNLRNDARFAVAFAATDMQGRRCTARMSVTVGNPPANLPAKVSEQAPKAGSDGYAVLPFQPFGMAFHDSSYAYYSMLTPTNWLNAAVIKKGSVGGGKPVHLTPAEVGLDYSAASNPWDPAGPDSINSTSQNYPLGKTAGEAGVAKSDWFDPCRVWKNPNPNSTNAGDTQFQSFFDLYLTQPVDLWRILEPRPGAGAVAGVSGDLTNAECNYSNFFLPNWQGHLPPFDPANPKTFSYMHLKPDEGAAFWTYDMISRFDAIQPASTDFPGFRGVMLPNGSPMPGRDAPYQGNAPQAFPSTVMPEPGDNYPGFDDTRNLFAAVGFPQFPTDDKGRHNAYPLMRIRAHDKAGKLLGTTDAVTAVTTEFKCAECHAKGKNGADQSVYDGLRADMAANKPGLEKYKGREKWIPAFLAPEDVNPSRKNDRDVIEQASMINIARLHDFYYNFIEESGWLGPLEFESETIYGKASELRVQPGNCTDYCHKSVPRADPRRYNMAPVYDAGNACPEMSDSLHNIHGRLIGTMNADYTGTIERDPLTRELKLADLTKPDKNKPFLLSVKDTGAPDDSCFYCHAGKQDKYQRDVMTAAGVNCIDCHGDLAVLAGGGAMTSRGKGENPLDSRGGTGDLTSPIDKDKLAQAYMAHESSYGAKADGSWYLVEKGVDGIYRRKDKVVTTLDMALVFAGGDGAANADGTYTLSEDGKSETLTEAQLLDKVKTDVNGWLLSFGRIPWAEELSCANCHAGLGDEPVRRRAYDMTTGQFRLNKVTDERFAENLQPKKHDSSFTLEVQDGQSCPPGTFSDTLIDSGKHVCTRGLFKDSLDRHGAVACQACHGPAHAIWPNPDPYANDNVTAMQLQGHAGTLLECTVCHTDDAFKDGKVDGLRYGDGLLAGPHGMHPVNDPTWWQERAGGPANATDGSRKGGWHNVWAKKAGASGEDQCAACHGKDHKGTRLSKSPIDREFADGKGKPVVVKAGEPVGCDLCHTLEQSFIK